MIEYIDEHQAEYGVESICQTLVAAGAGIAPSTYYASKQRPLSSRARRDLELSSRIVQLHQEHKSVYGVRKMWHLLQREGVPVARCTVSRLMRQLHLSGAVRGKRRITTLPAPAEQVASDLLQRRFNAEMPDRAWVADFSYVITYSGTVYVAFVIDCYSRRIVGWKAATSMATSLVLEALEMALWARGRAGHRIEPGGLIHHSDRGSQYTSIAFTERLLEAGVDASVGSQGDALDNALAESTIALFKTEVVKRRSWRSFEQIEYATAEWAEWYNHRRLHSACDYRPPAEAEAAYYAAGEDGVSLPGVPVGAENA